MQPYGACQGVQGGTQLWVFHPNSKRLIGLLRLLAFKPCAKTPPQADTVNQAEWPNLLCRCCGAVMTVMRCCI